MAARNLLLRSLDAACAHLIAPHLRLAAFTPASRLGGNDIYFPETLVASCLEVMPDGSRVAVGLIGREGLIGWPALIGGQPDDQGAAVLLGGGDALAIPAGRLADLCAASPALHQAMLRFVNSYTVQMARTVVSNLRDPLESRLARWIAMLHDRVEGDTLAITHQCLAEALNVRRASVTDSLHVLEGERVLRCTRALVTIRDRAALEAAAGAAYGAAEAAYSRLVTPFGKHAPAQLLVAQRA